MANRNIFAKKFEPAVLPSPMKPFLHMINLSLIMVGRSHPTLKKTFTCCNQFIFQGNATAACEDTGYIVIQKC